VPQDPPGHRTYVWRQLKELGAVYLQQAASILPDRPALRTALEGLRVRVRASQGDASLLTTTSPDPEWEQDIVERFNEARNEEYAELVENLERLEDELARESRKEKFTFAELEENEVTLDKLRRWEERIQARDFFGTPTRTEALAALDHAQRSLEAFAAEVYVRQGVQGGPSAERA
jgi:hypothetical protein